MTANSSLGVVFPGQGSQSLGMLSTMADAFPVVADTFAQASEVLGFDLWRMVQEGTRQALNQTRNTQPAMLAADVAVWRVWVAAGGPDPALMAGHSLGEYSALVCAGAMDFSDAVALVAERARLMQQAVPESSGAMAAVLGLDDDRVRELCAEAAQGEIVEPVNFNSPGQVVVAGTAAAVDRLIALAKPAGAKRALRLPVSVPSHCSLMQPAADQLAERLAQTPVLEPRVKVVHNVSAGVVHSPDEIRALLARQLSSPVRWVETIEFMAEQGIDEVLEMGPGKVLTGLNKRIVGSITALAVNDPDSLRAALKVVK